MDTDRNIFLNLFPKLSYKNPVRSSFLTYHRVWNKCNTVGVICWAYSSGAPDGSPSFLVEFVFLGLNWVFCVMFCRSLFVIFFCLCNVCHSLVYVFWLHFDIFKQFLRQNGMIFLSLTVLFCCFCLFVCCCFFFG